MNIGWHAICLKCEDLAASKAFYQALGMEVVHDSDQWVHLTNGNLHISLMTFLEENWINFRGADVSLVHETLQTAGLATTGSVEEYSADQMGSDGWHWRTQDPDGNVVYFDTTAEEAPKSMQVEQLLNDISRYLANAGIESSKFADFKAELTAKYLSNP